MRKNYSFIKLTSVLAGVGLLTSCSALNPPTEDISPFEGKVSVVGKEHVINEDPNILQEILKIETPKEEWKIELLFDRAEDRVNFITVDEESFDSFEVGQSFCYSNLSEVASMEQVQGEAECEF